MLHLLLASNFLNQFFVQMEYIPFTFTMIYIAAIYFEYIVKICPILPFDVLMSDQICAMKRKRIYMKPLNEDL